MILANQSLEMLKRSLTLYSTGLALSHTHQNFDIFLKPRLRSRIMSQTEVGDQMRCDRKARKRQKLSSGFISRLNSTRVATTCVEALPWTSVPVPDDLGDAEGFYGLEELSNVEIVRDEHAGRIEFRVGMLF